MPNALQRVCAALLQTFAVAFTRPTDERFVVLLFAAILTTACRTILNLLRTVDTLAPGHPSSYHRLFFPRRWSLWRRGRARAGFLRQRWLPTGTGPVAGAAPGTARPVFVVVIKTTSAGRFSWHGWILTEFSSA